MAEYLKNFVYIKKFVAAISGNEKIILILVCLVFLSFVLPNIEIPAVDSDEACDGLWASYILEPRQDMVTPYFFLSWQGKFFPIMANNPYTDTLESYLLVPFFAIFGIKVFSLRLLPILFCIISIIFIYQLCKVWFSRRVALLTIILTATHPVFVHNSKIGLRSEEIFTIGFFWIGLYFLQMYYQRKGTRYIYIALYLFGLGLSHKITFFWYILGLGVSVIVLNKRLLKPGLFKIREIFFGLISFFAGSFFLLFFNLRSGGETIKFLFNNLFYPTQAYFVNNLNYLDNFTVRAQQFYESILKGKFEDYKTFSGLTEQGSLNSIFFILFALGFIVVPLLTFLKNASKFSKNKIIFLYILFLTVFLCSPFTLSHLHFSHLLVLYPFPQIIISLFLCSLLSLSVRKKVITLAIYSVLVVVIFCNSKLTTNYYLQLKKTGGYVPWSIALYDLADYLDRNHIIEIIALRGMLHHNIPFLTGNRIRPIPVEGHSSASFKEMLIKEYISRKRPVYIVDDAGVQNYFMKPEELKGILKSYNRDLTLVKVFL